jgi:cell division septal protein FtsQ
MARLVTPPPSNTAAEWGKRLAYLACVLLPILWLLVLLLNERDPTLDRITWDNVSLSSTPPMAKADFLREIRAGGRFNETLDLHDPELFEKLRQAVQRHDWVQDVSRVSLIAPRTIHIDLTFRTPVAKLQRGLQVNLVDRFGKILLPLTPDQGSSLISLVGWGERSLSDA